MPGSTLKTWPTSSTSSDSGRRPAPRARPGPGRDRARGRSARRSRLPRSPGARSHPPPARSCPVGCPRAASWASRQTVVDPRELVGQLAGRERPRAIRAVAVDDAAGVHDHERARARWAGRSAPSAGSSRTGPRPRGSRTRGPRRHARAAAARCARRCRARCGRRTVRRRAPRRRDRRPRTPAGSPRSRSAPSPRAWPRRRPLDGSSTTPAERSRSQLAYVRCPASNATGPSTVSRQVARGVARRCTASTPSMRRRAPGSESR